MNAPTFQLTGLSGANFQKDSVVLWNDAARQPIQTGFVSPSQLTAVVTPTFVNRAITIIVTVKNPDGSISNPVLFPVGNAPAIDVGGLSPGTAVAGQPTFTIAINGSNFQLAPRRAGMPEMVRKTLLRDMPIRNSCQRSSRPAARKCRVCPDYSSEPRWRRFERTKLPGYVNAALGTRD